MSLTLISPPSVEPVSLALARLQCKVEGTDEDELLALYITAARMQCEGLIGRALITQTWLQVEDRFPCDNEGIRLRKPPVANIASVSYIDAAGDTQTMPVDSYVLDAAVPPGGWLLPADGTIWPSTDDVINAVTVEMVCGYGDDATDVPTPLRSWMLMTIAYLYDQRTAADVAGRAGALPDRFYHSLLDPFIVYDL